MSHLLRKQTCETHGHIYGHRGECLFCGHVLKQQDPPMNCQGEPFTREERRFGSRILLLLLVAIVITSCVLASGCTYGEIYARHVSHPLAGRPFQSETDRDGKFVEGAINEVGFAAGRCYGAVCIEQSLGYDFTAGCQACMRGGPVLYTGKVSVRLFGESRR